MSQRAVLAAGAVAAAAAWLIRRTKQGDERRERAGSIAYDHDDTLFRVMRADALAAASREPWMAGILQHIIDARCFEDAVANMLMHKLAYETTNKQEMRRKLTSRTMAQEARRRRGAAAGRHAAPRVYCFGGERRARSSRASSPVSKASRHPARIKSAIRRASLVV